MSWALDDIHDLGGIESENDYPYTASEWDDCVFNKAKVVLTDRGASDLPPNDEKTLKMVVAKYGPVAIAMEVTEMFQHYKSGILDDPHCGTKPNHAILVVGYGTDPEHGDFWLVKNSLGAQWGDQGYIRLKRGLRMCGISKLSTVPIFTKNSS